VVIAVVGQALWHLGRTALKSRWLVLLGVASAVAVVAGANELVVLAAAAVSSALVQRSSTAGSASSVVALTAGATVSTNIAAAAAASAPVGFGLWPLFLVFLKIGSVLFGSGYVLLAFLRSDLVERLHWLSEAQLLDAVAVGQVTPGPVFTTATFVGYVLGGPAAAAVATVGIFLPAFVFVALSGPLVPRVRRSAVAGAVLDGVNVASLALMAVVSWNLGRSALNDAPTIAIACASAVALLKYRVNSTWLIAAGAGVGWLVLTLASRPGP